MKTTIEWINIIIEELTDNSVNLKDTLLKVQTLAHIIKYNKLKVWVSNELNGYKTEYLPSYRILSSAVHGHVIQDCGYRGTFTYSDYPLPLFSLDEKYKNIFGLVKMFYPVSELEFMSRQSTSYRIDIPHVFFGLFNQFLERNCGITSAWQVITINSIQGVLSSIKSQLLNFMLELADEIGESDKIDIKIKKNKIDKLFDETIGQITGEVINVSVGDNNLQSLNTGEHSNLNISIGNNNKQKIDIGIKTELNDFLKVLKEIINDINLNEDDRVDLDSEIRRIEIQVERKEPKRSIISTSLNVIHQILLNVVSNAVTPSILSSLQNLISSFS